MKRKEFLVSLGALIVTPFLPRQLKGVNKPLVSNNRHGESRATGTKYLMLHEYENRQFKKSVNCPRCGYGGTYISNKMQDSPILDDRKIATTLLRCPKCQFMLGWGMGIPDAYL
jgi:predicted nucleic-acid-binding Zn-ribbon protein